jgi:redox-sensing transcriptional repressor
METIDKVKGTYEKRLENDTARPYVSAAVIKRLPRYHRYLGELLRAGTLRISSQALSRLMSVTASQIRQDLNCFGGFGQQGYGYNVKYLYGKISELLGVREGYKAVIVGAGNLGSALAATPMFERRGVTRVAMFDVDKSIIGTKIYNTPVYDVSTLVEFCRENKIDIGIICVPKDQADDVASRLISGGVSGIWNFASTELHVDKEAVALENMHLGDSLMKLCYEIKIRGEKDENE